MESAKPSLRHGVHSAPWEQWELNPKFFAALTRWTLENPESTLDRVFDRVSHAIECKREFFEVLPDGAFPARGLVKALAHILILGDTVRRAKREIQSFARDVIRWVGEIRSAFDTTRHTLFGRPWAGKFTQITWQNLARMRDLIDEICLWGFKRLTDKRWLTSGTKAKSVKNEIAQFEARISETRETFKDRSIIAFAWGLDALIQRIRLLLHGQSQIKFTLERIKAAQDDFFDDLSVQKEAQMRRQYVADMLASHTVENTSYSDQGKLPCDKDTRVDVLKEIMDWVNDCTLTSRNFLWLTGDPGSGKSAITASIARRCKDKGYLWAQYFINRNNFDTTNPNAYFPSIARQFSAYSEEVVKSIFNHLKAQPSLLDAMSSEQAASLFIDTIRAASDLDPHKPVVVIIDGLDETDRQHLKSVADIFSKLFSSLSQLPNAKVFISSRTEDDIRNPFARTLTTKHVKHLHLDTASASSINDVAKFLRRKIAQIVLDNDLDWNIWPGDQRFNKLAVRASGLFVWAVTAAKFIQEQIDQWGTECLNDLLDNLNSDGMGDINELYGFILEMSYKRQEDGWAFECFRRIVGAIVVLQEPLCLEDLSILLSLQRSPTSSPVDVIKFVKRLRTVLVAGTAAIDGQTTPRLHKSFYEYITDGTRVNVRFYIKPLISHQEIASRCLHQLTIAKSVIKADLPTLFRYAIKFSSVHLLKMAGTASGLALVDTHISLNQFQNLLRISSNGTGSSPVFIKLSPDKSVIQASLDNRTRLWSMAAGQQVQETVVLQDHTSILPFARYSPDGSRIATSSWDGNICLWDPTTRRLMSQLEGNTRTVLLSISFSPDTQYIAAGFRDSTIYMWCQVSQELEYTFRGHTGPVASVSFSPDGESLVSGSGDHTIRRWNVRTGKQVGDPIVGHSRGVNEVIHSPDGQLIVSCSDDCTIRIWDSKTGKPSYEFPLTGHTLPVNAIAFLPDQHQIVSGSSDKTIRLWNSLTGKQDGAPLVGHTRGLRSIAVSPSGKQIASASSDGTIRFWDVGTRNPIGPPMAGHTKAVSSIAFSPNGDKIVSGSTDRTTRIWNAPLDDSFGAMSTSFSPSGNKILSVSIDHIIRLWHLKPEKTMGSVLDAELKNVISVAFSHDESCVAVASSDVVSIWRTSLPAESYEVASARLSDIEFVDFPSASNDLLRVVYQGQKHLFLRERGGTLTSVVLGHVELANISRNRDNRAQDNLGGAGLRWWPSTDIHTGLLAYVNHHIVRVGRDGSVVAVAAAVDSPNNCSTNGGTYHNFTQVV